MAQKHVDKIKKIAEESGFAMWADEPWKPEGLILGVDWSNNYDKELMTFYLNVRKQLRKEIKKELEND